MVRSVTSVLAALALSPLATTHAQERTVYRIPVAGSVEVDLSDLIGATLQAAEREPGSLVVLDSGASGGRMDIAQLIVGDLQRTSVPVYALVSGRAWQAAAPRAGGGLDLRGGGRLRWGRGRRAFIRILTRDFPRPTMNLFPVLDRQEADSVQLGDWPY